MSSTGASPEAGAPFAGGGEGSMIGRDRVPARSTAFADTSRPNRLGCSRCWGRNSGARPSTGLLRKRFREPDSTQVVDRPRARQFDGTIHLAHIDETVTGDIVVAKLLPNRVNHDTAIIRFGGRQYAERSVVVVRRSGITLRRKSPRICPSIERPELLEVPAGLDGKVSANSFKGCGCQASTVMVTRSSQLGTNPIQ